VREKEGKREKPEREGTRRRIKKIQNGWGETHQRKRRKANDKNS